MAGAHYTRRQLFFLRNHIPIDRVIEKTSLPSRKIKGQYRFCCPVCHNFNTGINPKTNLARCFECKKNYNTIDLVMTVMGLSFIDSVAYLETLQTPAQTSAQTATPPLPASRRSRTAVKSNEPVAIGDIFRSLATPGPAAPTPLGKKENRTIMDLQNRISALEKHVKSLTEKMALIERR